MTELHPLKAFGGNRYHYHPPGLVFTFEASVKCSAWKRRVCVAGFDSGRSGLLHLLSYHRWPTSSSCTPSSFLKSARLGSWNHVRMLSHSLLRVAWQPGLTFWDFSIVQFWQQMSCWWNERAAISRNTLICHLYFTLNVTLYFIPCLRKG